MNYKKSWIVLIVIALSFIASYSSNLANDSKDPLRTIEEVEQSMLQNLRGVIVMVSPLDSDIEKKGITEDRLQTDVELKLRMAGIQVLTWEKYLKELGMPSLLVNVKILKTEIGIYFFSINVDLGQKVVLFRDPSLTIIAATWSTGTMGYSGENKLNTIRDALKDCIDKFINAYLAANPKK